MLCGRRLVWHKSISQIFVFFLSGFSMILKKKQNLRSDLLRTEVQAVDTLPTAYLPVRVQPGSQGSAA
ncbi:MAG: hypothetical protein II045_04705, partial [Oscillospiraceae bacterium]|nr:hypothetical protein [Oscillospiraceae bacterium]